MHAPKGPSRPCDRTVSKIYHIIPVFHYWGRRSQKSELFIGEGEPEERKKEKKWSFYYFFPLTNPPSTPWHQKKKFCAYSSFLGLFFSFSRLSKPEPGPSRWLVWILYDTGGSGIIITIIIHDQHIQLADPHISICSKSKLKVSQYILFFFLIFFKGVSRRAVH